MALANSVRARVLAVVCEGLGADGALGPDALARSIPADEFHPAGRDTPLRGNSYAAEDFDRAVQVRWLSILDEPEESNELDPNALRIARFEVLVGYLTASVLAPQAQLLGSEAMEDAVAEWTDRAIDDAERIKRALCFAQLSCGALATARLVGFAREGSTVTDDSVGEGRGLAITTYRVTLGYTLASTALDP